MATGDPKTLSIQLTPELHRQLRALVGLQGTTLKAWVTDAITEKMERESAPARPPSGKS